MGYISAPVCIGSGVIICGCVWLCVCRQKSRMVQSTPLNIASLVGVWHDVLSCALSCHQLSAHFLWHSWFDLQQPIQRLRRTLQFTKQEHLECIQMSPVWYSVLLMANAYAHTKFCEKPSTIFELHLENWLRSDSGPQVAHFIEGHSQVAHTTLHPN